MRFLFTFLGHRKRYWLSILLLFYAALMGLAWIAADLPISPFVYDIF